MNGYALKSLSSIADVISGFAFKSIWFGSGKDKIVRISDLINCEVSLKHTVIFDANEHPVSTRYQIQDGDILVALSGATTGKIGVATTETTGAYVNQRVAIVRGFNKHHSEYLRYILQSSYMKDLLPSAEGAAQPNLSPKLLESLKIPIPPVSEQCQIAAQLKAQLAEVDKARQAVEVQLCDISNLANAIIYDSLKSNTPVKNSIAEALEEIKQGIGEDWAKYPALGATRNGLAPAKEPPGKKPHRYKPVSSGTVFYNPMRILIGSIAFVDVDDTPGITSPDYVALRGKQDIVDSRWFYYWLRSPLGEQFIKSLARGAVRERILFKRLAKGEIDLPSFRVQRAASKALVALKPMQQAIEEKIKEINLLPEKILAKVFEQ